jgi:hypothetical protein
MEISECTVFEFCQLLRACSAGARGADLLSRCLCFPVTSFGSQWGDHRMTGSRGWHPSAEPRSGSRTDQLGLRRSEPISGGQQGKWPRIGPAAYTGPHDSQLPTPRVQPVRGRVMIVAGFGSVTKRLADVLVRHRADCVLVEVNELSVRMKTEDPRCSGCSSSFGTRRSNRFMIRQPHRGALGC